MTEQKRVRGPRSDAVRNRQRLIEIAKAAFTQGEIDIRLDEIARRAGYGVGTLYRHFPNRDALIEAVYRAGIEELTDAASRFGASRPPRDALRDWMLLFVDYIATKQIIAPALNSLVGGPSPLYATTGGQIKDAIRNLVARAIESGDIRPDIDPLDLFRPLAGLAHVGTGPGWEASAKRLVDILMLGSRPTE